MENFDLHIHTNSNCNLSCKHCYNNSGARMAERLPLQDLYRYLLLFSENYICDIHLEGGEIFLYPEVFEILERMNEKMLKGITITTNGTVFIQNPRIISVLRRIGVLRISIEGHTQTIHEKVRNSCLEEVLSNAGFYQDQGINVIIRVTLNKYNERTLFHEGIGFLADNGFTKIQVYEFQEVGRGKKHDLKITGSFHKILDDFAAITKPVHIQMMLSKRRIPEVNNYNWKNKDVIVKYNGERNELAVKANGNVTICSWDDENVIANFSRMTDSEILSFLSANHFTHDCSFCSKVVLQKVNYEL